MTSRPAVASGFGDLGLSDSLLATITGLGYEEPTPVQREAIPLMLSGRDLLAEAATGTGKTAAFALPMIHAIEHAAAARSQEPGTRGKKGPAQTQAIVLVPTREL